LPGTKEPLGREELNHRYASTGASKEPLIKSLGLAIVLIALSLQHPASARDKLKVVTTTTDLQSLVQAVGGERVEVVSLAAPIQDAEVYEPRPQDMARLHGADMVVKVGLDYDLWIDRMLKQSGNSEIQRGGRGYVDAAFGIPLLEVRSTSVAAQVGHSHGAGNPHYWLDPMNAEVISGAIMEALDRLDPDSAGTYEANRAAFIERLKHKVDGWKSRLQPFNGMTLIAYHNSWPYFARRFRLNIVDYIEPKPGIPPSPAQLAALVRKMQAERVSVIIKQPFEPEQIPRMLASRTGARVAVLAPSVGALPGISDYFALFDYNVKELAEALAARRRE
jgi:ABC-type Zn uptake system ZnuABC Zn-binding protein ZnuA